MGRAAEALARYRCLFEADPARHLAAFEALRRPTFGAALPVLPRPLWLGASVRRAMVAAAEDLTVAHRALIAGYLQEGRHADHVALPPGAEALLRADPAGVDPAAFWRFDFLYEPRTGRLDFLELNAGDPSGLGYNEELVALFEAFEPFAALRAEFSLEPDRLMAAHRRTVTRRTGLERGFVVFLAAADSTVRADHQAMAADYRRAGWDAVVADPRELSELGEGLGLAGRPVGVVVRDTIDELLLPPFEAAGARLARAASKGSVQVLNPFCAAIGDAKSLFALISAHGDEAWPAARHMPWTRRIDAALRPRLLAGRRHLVLKPVEGYGGHGVVLGPACDEARWHLAIDRALAEPTRWIAQAYRPPGTALLPAWAGGRYLGFQRHFVTLSAWVMDGRVVGAFARVGNSRVVNVHQGGGMQPVFWLADA